MENPVRLTSIKFRNYKALQRFDLTLHRCNILVGPNNNGKSTVIGALRLLATALRKARATSPGWVQGERESEMGWELSSDNVPISLENVHTDYASTDTTITFQLSNGNALEIFFPKDGGCRLIPRAITGRVRTPAGFREAFPFKIAVVPVLGPIEHREPLLKKETVQQNLTTHRASRHFRNYWYHYPEGFQDFADMVSSTWPSMRVKRPSLENYDPMEVFMFTEEDRMPRELYWCGFGFQIWCQLLTHISRNRDADLIIVDEPEVYLHPDTQRQLLDVLKDAGPAILLATHSTEIMAEAEPHEIVLIDKQKETGRRLQNAHAVQAALTHVGSVHAITLVQAVRQRRVLYLDDPRQFALLKKLAQVGGFTELAANTDIVPLPSGGIEAWTEVRTVAKRAEEATGTKFRVGVIYGRGNRPAEEYEEVLTSLDKHVDFSAVFGQETLDDYLINPSVLDRVVANQLLAAGRKLPEDFCAGSGEILDDIKKPSSSALPALTNAKQILSAYRNEINERFAISFSDVKIAENFRKDEMPIELIQLLSDLEAFTRSF